MMIRFLFTAAIVLLSQVCAGADLAADAAALRRAGATAFENKQFSLAAVTYAKAFAIDPKVAISAYNSACAYARAGDKDKAFELLNRSFDAGIRDYPMVVNDKDFMSLYDDARWTAALKRLTDMRDYTMRLFWSSAFKTPYQENISDKEKLAGLSKLWSETKYNLADVELLRRIEWDKLYVDAIPAVLATTSTVQYFEVLRDFGSKLTGYEPLISPPRELALTLQGLPPFLTSLVEGKVMVGEVVDVTLHDQGVVPGVEVIDVDGVPAPSYGAANAAAHLGAASEHALKAAGAGPLFMVGAVETTSRVRFSGADGKQFSVPVTRVSALSRALSQSRQTGIEMLPGNVAYIPLRLFSEREIASLRKRFSEIANASAWIVDVRENQEGKLSGASQIARMLSPKPVRFTARLTRVHQVARDRYHGIDTPLRLEESDSLAPDLEHQFSGPVVMLTSALTASEGERLVSTLLELKRVTLVGERTAGQGCEGAGFELPGGAEATTCVLRSTYPNDMQRGGIGIVPNVAASQTINDLRQGRDTVLAVALNVLARQATAKP